jgi:DNA-binding NarL/FixJ family response regulator
VATKEEFVKALAAGKVDLVLSDYRMPGFDGAQALRLVQEKDKRLPCIIVASDLSKDRAAEIRKLGAAGYVPKNHLASLVPSIERALREA